MATFRTGGFAVVLAVIACLQAGPARAYSDEQQQACTPDAFRICGRYIPNIDSITACMIANTSQLSAACRATFPADYRVRRHFHRHRDGA
jgi:hypothetical protein